LTNVISFPTVCQKDGYIWHGGLGFKTQEDLMDALSDRDLRRVQDWQARHWDWLQANNGKRRGSTGGSAA
jgi:hypothetical protein